MISFQLIQGQLWVYTSVANRIQIMLINDPWNIIIVMKTGIYGVVVMLTTIATTENSIPSSETQEEVNSCTFVNGLRRKWSMTWVVAEYTYYTRDTAIGHLQKCDS